MVAFNFAYLQLSDISGALSYLCLPKVVQTVKHLPAMWETWVLSLGWEDPLEKEMEIHSSILAWKFPWTEEPGSLQSMWSQRVRHDQATNTHTHTYSEFS